MRFVAFHLFAKYMYQQAQHIALRCLPALAICLCLSALQLSQCGKLRDAWRADLFPSADMVVTMSREFGVPITADDFEGNCSPFSTSARQCCF